MAEDPVLHDGRSLSCRRSSEGDGFRRAFITLTLSLP